MHDAEELRRFARKDWAAAARGKELYRRDWKRKHGAAAGIRMADELRKQVLAQKPGWPSDEERREDWEAHWREIDAFEKLDAWRLRGSAGGDVGGKQSRGIEGDDFTHHTQSGDMDCGLACLRMVRDWLGLNVSEPELRKWWSAEEGIEPRVMLTAIQTLFGDFAKDLRKPDLVDNEVDERHTELGLNKSLLLLFISHWDAEGYNPCHWIIARDFRERSTKFSTRKTHPSKPPKGRELVALVHDPLHTMPYRQAWQSILAAPVLHGILLTDPEAW